MNVNKNDYFYSQLTAAYHQVSRVFWSFGDSIYWLLTGAVNFISPLNNAENIRNEFVYVSQVSREYSHFCLSGSNRSICLSHCNRL